MELTQYVENLRRELTTAAEVGGEDARALADRLLAPLDAAVRLTLLEALSAAAEEISAELAPGSVDVRLRGGRAGFVVTPPPAPAAPAAAPAADDAVAGPLEVRLPVAEGDDAAMVRINLRLPANLKALIEDAAAGGGLSVNAWIVRAAAAGLSNEGRRATRPAPAQKPDRTVGQSYSGWAR
ncbi:hypothetical protein ABIA33_001626 [Streptacidiphilus sp. MAP12-16]|uniref:hypothetical protein n=1 Tax=Streptacidiphilus sp. MAP12-16 TaxID=3156300 RepID=UPI003515313F